MRQHWLIETQSSLPKSAATVFHFDTVGKYLKYTGTFGITLYSVDIFGSPQRMSLISEPDNGFGYTNLTILEDWEGDPRTGQPPGTLLITESTDSNDVFSPARAWEACERYDANRQQWSSLGDIWFNGCDLVDDRVRWIGYLYVEYI